MNSNILFLLIMVAVIQMKVRLVILTLEVIIWSITSSDRSLYPDEWSEFSARHNNSNCSCP